MRVLHVVRSDGFAGVEGFVAGLARAQADAGMDVGVIGGDPARMSRRLGPDLPHAPAASVMDVVRQVRGALAGAGADVLNVHMTAAEIGTSVAMALPPAARAGRRPRPAVIATRHFAARRGSGSHLAGRLVAFLAERFVDAEIAVSRYVAEAVGGNPEVVHTGVPVRTLIDPATGVSRGRVVLVAQRLEPEKRTEDAVEVFARSGLADAGWRLEIAGDGSMRGRLAERAARLGVAGSVDLLGMRSDIGELMDAAGILLAPTPREGLGLSVLEAMAAGLPVLAAGSGGHLETVGSVPGGQLYGDLAEGADRLRRLAEDESGRAAYGERLRRVQRERFTMEHQVAATAAVYRRVVEGRS